MKTKLIVISIVAFAIISVGATKLVRSEKTDNAATSSIKSTSSPIGGIMADYK
jgi:hypothetical protein